MRYIVFPIHTIRILQGVRRTTWHAGPRGRPVARRARTRGTHGLRGSGTPEPTGSRGPQSPRPRSRRPQSRGPEPGTPESRGPELGTPEPRGPEPRGPEPPEPDRIS